MGPARQGLDLVRRRSGVPASWALKACNALMPRAKCDDRFSRQGQGLCPSCLEAGPAKSSPLKTNT